MPIYTFNYDQYKKTLNKKNPYSFTLLFLSIILLLGLCVYLHPKYDKYYKYHFVEVNCFQTYKDATKLANSIQAQNAAGYIYFDGKYHVLASFYVEYDDAKTVVENLKATYSTAKVFTIETKKFVNNSNLNSSQNNAVRNLLDATKEQIVRLEQLSNEFDSKNITYSELSIHLKNIQKDYTDKLDNFLSKFKSYSKYNLAKEYLEEINSSLETLSGEIEQNLSKALRYQLINIVINRCQFLSCF